MSEDESRHLEVRSHGRLMHFSHQPPTCPHDAIASGTSATYNFSLEVDDIETLKACSLAIPSLRLDLLRAVFSQLTITFKFAIKDHGKRLKDRICSFLEILQANPSYSKFICNLRIDLNDVKYLHDVILSESIGVALSRCTDVHRLSIVAERPENLQWFLVPSAIRVAAEDMLRSGKLRHLEMQSISLPWTTLLAPGDGPLSLSLGDVNDIPSGATSVDISRAVIPISSLRASVASLPHLLQVEVIEDSLKRPLFDLRELQTFELEWSAPSGLQHVREVLFRSPRLRALSMDMRYTGVPFSRLLISPRES